MMEASVPGPVALIIDCPGDEYLAALQSAPALHQSTGSTSQPAAPAVAVHLGPHRVCLADPCAAMQMQQQNAQAANLASIQSVHVQHCC